MPVEAIHLGAPRVAELWTVESARAVAGKGLEGDRHFHVEELTRPGMIKALVHRAGINADIVSGGTIRVGDEVTVD